MSCIGKCKNIRINIERRGMHIFVKIGILIKIIKITTDLKIRSKNIQFLFL